MSETTSNLFEPNLESGKEARRVLTVSQITHDIKLILESSLGEVWVEGEVSNFRAYPSGHFYFTLKDAQAVLPAVMFRGANKELKFKIEDGLKVISFGKISAYGASGQYQIILEKLEPKGIGSLQLALEQLKEKLEKEGLFAAAHKRPIPYLPAKVGIVTSLEGAAIKDILKVLDRRFKDIEIIINPAQVQGESAKTEVSQAIRDFNLYNESLPQGERIEVMIVGRGGGSIEDLWAFNEEIVARAIYNSRIPIISAVGHERDWTIADLVADVRAATPSVAAELVIPKKEELKEKIDSLQETISRDFLDILFDFKLDLDNFLRRLNLGIQNTLKFNANEFDSLRKKLGLLNPVLLLQQYQVRILDLARQIYIRAGHFLKLRQTEFNLKVEKLSTLSPLNILGRGYSITFKMPENSVVRDVKLIKAGDTLKTRLQKGEILSQITEVRKDG